MDEQAYQLDEQVGFLLRRANQRHLSVFAGLIPELTTTQFAAIARLADEGPMSQNQLGRATAMDAATIKGVVGRLEKRLASRRLPTSIRRSRIDKWAGADLNRRHPHFQCGALPTELPARTGARVEPLAGSGHCGPAPIAR